MSNMELFVKNKIAEIKSQALAEKFTAYLNHPNKKKVGMRIDYDIYCFYKKIGDKYQTAINCALRAVKEAVEQGKMSLN